MPQRSVQRLKLPTITSLSFHNTFVEKTLSLDCLPENLCFDEFKSTKSAEGAMSFLFCNADTKKIIDSVEDRKLKP